MTNYSTYVKNCQKEDVVCMIADALRGGDRVILNGRSRPVEVLGREVEPDPGMVKTSDYPYRIVWLRGNGTEYRLRYSHIGEYYPHVHTESQLVTDEIFSLKYSEPRVQTRTTDRGERVRQILVDGVSRDELREWAFVRNIGGIEELDEHGERMNP